MSKTQHLNPRARDASRSIVAGSTSILFISQQIPWPKDSGGNLRTYHLLESLCKHFKVSLVTSAKSGSDSLRGKAELESMCHKVAVVPSDKTTKLGTLFRTALKSLASGVPVTVQHNFSKQIAATVHRWVHSERFDFVHLNHIDTVPYTAATGAIPRVIDTHNLLYQYYQRRASLERNLALRALLGRESRQFQKFENEAFSNARFVLVCSREEAESAKGATPDIELDVVPNGVDCEFFKPGPDGKDASSQDLVFVGDMGYGPNQDAVLWFIEAVLPALRERVPGARLVVVGKNPDQTLLEMSSKREDVAVTGYVEDVREWVWSSRISVVPIRYGSGTRLKVLEAFAMGIPTVSTAVGAEGIAYQDGVDVLIANDPESMVHSICRLLSDQALYDTLRRNCRRTAQNRYDWSIIGRQLVDIYQGLLQRSPSQVLDHQQTP